MRRVLLLLMGLLALAPSGASAHPDLATSRPVAGTSVPGPLSELVLLFTKPVELRYTTVVLITATGDTIRGVVAREGTDERAVRVTLTEPLAAAVYRVAWRTAGADGHVVGGEYAFTVQAHDGTTAAPLPPESDLAAHHPQASTPDVNRRPAAALIRWLNFTFIVLLGGGIAFPLLLRGVPPRSPLGPTRTAGRRARRMTLAVASGLLVMAVIRLEFQSSMLHGGENAWNFELLSSLITRTDWGRGWAMQIVGAAIVLVTLAPRTASDAARGTAALAFVLLAIGVALGGHAATVESSVIPAWATDATHVIAASAWIGSLAYLLVVAIPIALSARTDEDFGIVVREFSRVALVAAPLVLLSGGLSALLHVGRWQDLWLTDYGRLLAVKVAVVGMTGATGFYNWRWVQPALGERTATRRLRRSAAVEVAAALVVLIVTALLVATAPPSP